MTRKPAAKGGAGPAEAELQQLRGLTLVAVLVLLVVLIRYLLRLL